MGNILRNEKKNVIRTSVRGLVEFILRSGDLDARVSPGGDRDAMQAGARAHRKIQKGMNGDYRSEVTLTDETDCGDFLLRVEGRADGIFPETDGEAAIDEIKGIYQDLDGLEEPYPLHLAQAKCYAAIYLKTEVSDHIGVRMTYVNLDTGKLRYFHYSYSREELSSWYEGVIRKYLLWARWSFDWAVTRTESMSRLEFPFPYRKGQQMLVSSVYHTICESRELFLMAPTGVGKTMAVVYPSVRAVGEGIGEKIFYLTAKNQTISVGTEAFGILQKLGLKMKVMVITAKEKICPLHEPSCNPDDCPYAKGHFDRVNDALFELLNTADFFGRETILQQAEKWRVCPFELSLDLASWSDAILCDYNYCFDPNASLKRFFGEDSKGEYIFLVDEAHNLVERCRKMYSAQLKKEDVLSAKRILKGRSKAVRALEKLNRQLLVLKNECETYEVLPDAGLIAESALRVLGEMETVFKEEKNAALKENLLDFYFELREFSSVFEELDDDYVVYTDFNEDGEFIYHLFCVNPARKLQSFIDKGRSAVLFSATFLPISYYRTLLSTRQDNYAIYAESPFDGKNKTILIGCDVSTRYKTRGYGEYSRIAGYIHETVSAHRGNYLAFFPSYKFMEDVLKIYREEYDEPDVNWVAQTRSMQEEDREIFLENFYEDPEHTLVGFCVMGGAFAEGIDLTGTRLIGALVVGCGLPQLSNESEILRMYGNGRGLDGYAFAYLYPGMNKVLQAAGRVIRTADDRGVILLLDDRFTEEKCRLLFPREWKEYRICRISGVRGLLEDFWNPA